MAEIEYWIGTQGPFIADDTDPEHGYDGQVVRKKEMDDALMPPSDTVVSETAFGQSPSAGTSLEYARGDHTHGTPSGAFIEDAPADGKIYVRRNNAWEELIIS